MPSLTKSPVAALIARSNALGSDPKNTNYAGGNTSAKGTETDPVTGDDVELLWVKGSGGDLGTLTESGLAVLRLDGLVATRREGLNIFYRIADTSALQVIETLADIFCPEE